MHDHSHKVTYQLPLIKLWTADNDYSEVFCNANKRASTSCTVSNEVPDSGVRKTVISMCTSIFCVCIMCVV